MGIPKIIHYCWFGRNPLPKLAQKCIESWKKYFPDYEIKEWNEDNYDVNKIPYIKEAYDAKKYAFVSDYARFDILYQYGGIYFDTDVEVVKPFDEILKNGPFMGCERNGTESNDSKIAVAPGLGIAAMAGMPIYKEILEDYRNSHFCSDRNYSAVKTVVLFATELLLKHGLQSGDHVQEVAGLKIYPKEYFAPKDVDTKKLIITKNTYSIHHYDASWAEWYDKREGERGPKLRKIFGKWLGNKINITIYVIQKYGFFGAIKKVFIRKKK